LYLPRVALRYLDRLEELVGVPIRLVSFGSGRDDTVVRQTARRTAPAVGR
jgi:adenylosuccinate synthase